MNFEQASKKYPIVLTTTGCWEWVGRRNRNGYGLADFFKKERLSHRLFYFLHHGVLPVGLVLDHQCCNKACCNPLHLEAVTSAENTRRWSATLSHCKHGHELSGENVSVRKDGRRRCKECHRAANRKTKNTECA